jgi:hypothetical protein
MQTSQITILDYDLTSAPSKGWAKVGLFGQYVDGEYSGSMVEFQFAQYDAVTAAIELEFMEQPDDRDEGRVGYENPLFSATCRESLDYAKRIKYTDNIFVLNEFSCTDFAEQIVRRLALQAPSVREVIQAEATSIACCDSPSSIVSESDLMEWFADNNHQDFLCGIVDWKAVSQHKKAGLRTENKIVEKLL